MTHHIRTDLIAKFVVVWHSLLCEKVQGVGENIHSHYAGAVPSKWPHAADWLYNHRAKASKLPRTDLKRMGSLRSPQINTFTVIKTLLTACAFILSSNRGNSEKPLLCSRLRKTRRYINMSSVLESATFSSNGCNRWRSVLQAPPPVKCRFHRIWTSALRNKVNNFIGLGFMSKTLRLIKKTLEMSEPDRGHKQCEK